MVEEPIQTRQKMDILKYVLSDEPWISEDFLHISLQYLKKEKAFWPFSFLDEK